jgi:hypothetical protein
MTRQKELSGAKVKLVVIDPWDFVTANGSGPFLATVLQVGRDQTTNYTALLLQVDPPFHYKGVECKYLVGSPRHEGRSIEQVFSGEQVTCSFTCIPEDRVKSSNPFDLSWWRGGPSVIADVSLQH